MVFANKANLRDLIAATGLKLDSNRQFFRPCDREIWWMISKNNRALVLYYIKLCASFQIHWWIQTGFTVQKRSIQVEIGDIPASIVTLAQRQPLHWANVGIPTLGQHGFVNWPNIGTPTLAQRCTNIGPTLAH